MEAAVEPPAKRTLAARAERGLLRLVRSAAAIYLGVVLVLILLENWLVYRPMRASDGWQPAPPDAPMVDVDLVASDGTKIHGWYHARPDAQGALLHLHGNAGNLSH